MVSSIQEELDRIRSNTAIEVHLFCSHIDDNGAHDLADALKTNTALTALFLNENNIGDDGARDLARALKTNTALTTLGLHENSIGNVGVRGLASVLKTNAVLTRLDLSGNSVSDDGAHYLGNALKTNATLKLLDLAYNLIGDRSARCLANALKTNATLTTLYLDCNNITDNGVRCLADALKTNATLTTLGLSYNSIHDGGACALADVIQENATLTEMDLRENFFQRTGRHALARGLIQQYNKLKILVLVGLELGDPRDAIRSVGPLEHAPADTPTHDIKALINHLKRLTSNISRRRVNLFVTGDERVEKTTVLDTIMIFRIFCSTIYCQRDIPCEVYLRGSSLTAYRDNTQLYMAVLTKEWTKVHDGNRLTLVPQAPNEPKIVLELPHSIETLRFLSRIDRILHEQPTHDIDVRRFFINDSAYASDGVEVSAWDFGGQRDRFENLHHISRDEALYLVVWDITKQSHDDASNNLLLWLRLISAQLPLPTEHATDRKAVIIIVGTHFDLLSPDKRYASRKLRDQFVRTTAARAGLTWPFEIVEISSKAPYFIGHDQLYGLVSSAARRLADDGKRVPDTCIATELLINEIASTKQKQGELPIISVSDLCSRTLFPAKAVKSALEILNNWGCVIYRPDVSDLIILDPTFLFQQTMDELFRPVRPHIVEGQLPLGQLHFLWQHDSSPVAYRDAILALMKHFGVCHMATGTDTVVFPITSRMC